MTVFFCLPAYNEEAGIRDLLEDIYNQFRDIGEDYKVVVIDDGSTDKTGKIIEYFRYIMPMEIIEHNENKGLGSALNSGMKYISWNGEDDDIIVCMDSDNTHSPSVVFSMLEKIREGNDIVIASRYLPNSKVIGVSLFRKFLSYSARFLFHIMAPIKGVKDFTCGFRAFRVSIIKKAYQLYNEDFITQDGFACTDEILLKCSRITDKITEVPFILRYDLKKTPSKLNLGVTVKETFKLLWKSRKL